MEYLNLIYTLMTTGMTEAEARAKVDADIQALVAPTEFDKVAHLAILQEERAEIEASDHPNKNGMLAKHDAEIAKYS